MKYYIKLLFLALAVSCKAVSQIPQANTYIQNSYINKFQGIWKWSSGSDSVVLKIGKVQYYYATPPQSSEDVLVGCHAYYSGGVLVESSLQRFDSVININHKRNTLFCYNLNDMDTSKAEGTFKDITKNKQGDVFLEYINSYPPQIIWTLKGSPGLVATLPGTTIQYGFTLPRNLILIKQ